MQLFPYLSKAVLVATALLSLPALTIGAVQTIPLTRKELRFANNGLQNRRAISANSALFQDEVLYLS